MSMVATAIAIIALADAALALGVLLMVRRLRPAPPGGAQSARSARRHPAAVGTAVST